MKQQIKPFLFLIAGIAIAFLVSFKNQEPVREYAFLSLVPTAIQVNYGNNIVKQFKTKSDSQNNDIATIVNEMSKEGWVIIDNDNPKGDFSIQRITLERLR